MPKWSKNEINIMSKVGRNDLNSAQRLQYRLVYCCYAVDNEAYHSKKLICG